MTDFDKIIRGLSLLGLFLAGASYGYFYAGWEENRAMKLHYSDVPPKITAVR